jgi:hypothetical protein
MRVYRAGAAGADELCTAVPYFSGIACSKLLR